MKPRNAPPGKRPTDRTTSTTGGEVARYFTREEQLDELVEHMRRRDRRLARAIVAMLSAPPRTLAAFGTVLAFVRRQTLHDARRAGGER